MPDSQEMIQVGVSHPLISSISQPATRSRLCAAWLNPGTQIESLDHWERIRRALGYSLSVGSPSTLPIDQTVGVICLGGLKEEGSRDTDGLVFRYECDLIRRAKPCSDNNLGC